MLKDLRTLYELRKIVPLEPRHAVARLFVVRGKYGLVDGSGILWPIYFRSHIKPPRALDIVRFSSSAFRPDGADANKYQDDGYFLVVEDIFEVVTSSEGWTNQTLPTPVPDARVFDEVEEPTHTFYFPAPHHDRIANLENKNRAMQRASDFFKNRGFMNVETPTLVPSGGVERYLAPFKSEYIDFRKRKWSLEMPTSPEFALKKFLVEGHKKIFQIARAFRSEGQLSDWHEPEFLMLEWYRIGASLDDIVEDTKLLVSALAKALPTNWEPATSWRHFEVNELFKLYASIDLEQVQNVDAFFEKAQPVSVSVQQDDDWDTLFCKVLMDCIEPKLRDFEACVVTDFPKQMCALAQVPNGSAFAKRFEVYIRGVEICNGYLELSDSVELERRFAETSQHRSDLSRDAVFESAMRFGLPPCAGNALGLDRLIAVLCGSQKISDFYAFPFLSQFEAGLD